MWAETAPVSISEIITIGIMLIPLIFFSIRYAVARNQYLQRCIYVADPRIQHFSALRCFWPRENDELDAKWDTKLKDVPNWQATLGIYKDPKEYKQLVLDAMDYKKKGWNHIGVAISGSIFRILLLNIALFGIFIYPTMLVAAGSALRVFGISKGAPTADLMGIFTIIFGIIIIKRIIRLKKATDYHNILVKEMDAEPHVLSDVDHHIVHDKSVTNIWSWRGYLIQKICDKHFGGNESELIAYAGNPANKHNQLVALAQQITDGQISTWYAKPCYDKYETEEDRFMGFCDTENLLFGFFLLIMVCTIVGIIVQLGMVTQVFGVFFDFIDWICHIGSNIGG